MRRILSSRWAWSAARPRAHPRARREDYRDLHLAVPVLGLRVHGSKHLEMPLAATPWLDDFRGHDVDQDLGERPPFRVAVEVIGGLVPAEVGIHHHREEQIVAVVHHDDLAGGAFDRRVVDQILLGAVRADIPLQRELAGDDLLDRDLLLPAVAAVAFLAAWFGGILRAAQRALRLLDT